jgi:hypothetical protein
MLMPSVNETIPEKTTKKVSELWYLRFCALFSYYSRRDLDDWIPRKCCLLLHRPKVIKGIYAGQILKTE